MATYRNPTYKPLAEAGTSDNKKSNKDLDVSVTRVLQTVAGRMIFAQPRLD